MRGYCPEFGEREGSRHWLGVKRYLAEFEAGRPMADCLYVQICWE